MTAATPEKRRGATINNLVPDGYHTVSEAAKLVGKSQDTLVRWRKSDPPVFMPEHYMMAGSTIVYLYSEEDIETLKKIAAKIKPGPKPHEE